MLTLTLFRFNNIFDTCWHLGENVNQQRPTTSSENGGPFCIYKKQKYIKRPAARGFCQHKFDLDQQQGSSVIGHQVISGRIWAVSLIRSDPACTAQSSALSCCLLSSPVSCFAVCAVCWVLDQFSIIRGVGSIFDSLCLSPSPIPHTNTLPYPALPC